MLQDKFLLKRKFAISEIDSDFYSVTKMSEDLNTCGFFISFLNDVVIVFFINCFNNDNSQIHFHATGVNVYQRF